MKRILIFMTLLISLPLSFALAAIPVPKLTVSSPVDLGKVQAGHVLERLVTLQNSGDADLVINSLSTNCPCTSFQFPDMEGTYQPWQKVNKITIRPGEKSGLKIVFDSNYTKYRGEFLRLITISSNDPEEPTKQVEMVGEIWE